MGHVNNATYLQYMETARVELARSLGQVREGFRPGFIIASARCEFKKPIRDERRITVSVWVSRIGVRSWDLDYSIRGPRGVQYAVGRTTQVAYDYKTRSAAKDLRKAQERTGEVRRSASQVQRNRLRPVFPQPPASLSGIIDTSERGNATTWLSFEKILYQGCFPGCCVIGGGIS